MKVIFRIFSNHFFKNNVYRVRFGLHIWVNDLPGQFGIAHEHALKIIAGEVAVCLNCNDRNTRFCQRFCHINIIPYDTGGTGADDDDGARPWLLS